MGLGCGKRDDQLVGYLLIGIAFDNQIEYFEFPGRERVRQRRQVAAFVVMMLMTCSMAAVIATALAFALSLTLIRIFRLSTGF